MALFKRKLLLKSDDETIQHLFGLFTKDFRFKGLFRSNYVKAIIQQFGIHGRLVEGFKEFSYEAYFSKEDTDMIVNIILFNASSIKIPDEFKIYTKKGSKDSESHQFMLPFVYVINELTSKFDLAIFNNEVELMNLIKIRDKFYAFTLDNTEAILRKWDFVKKRDSTEQETHLRVYKETIRHYLQKYMENFTAKIHDRAKEIGLAFKTEYKEVGTLFKKRN